MGLDPSSHTGYVVLGDMGDVAIVGTIHHKPTDERFSRYANYVDDVVDIINAYGVDLVIIEGYSFAGKFTNYFQYELGASLRMVFHNNEVPYIEVPPTSLKKFVTGKGNSAKNLMLLDVYKRWEFDTEDDNEADAYGLAQFGRAIIGKETGVPQVNLSAVLSLLDKSKQPTLHNVAKIG